MAISSTRPQALPPLRRVLIVGGGGREQRQETANINKSLLALANCINALSAQATAAAAAAAAGSGGRSRYLVLPTGQTRL